MLLGQISAAGVTSVHTQQLWKSHLLVYRCTLLWLSHALAGHLLPGYSAQCCSCVQVDKLAEGLMLPGVRSLRAMLHATAVEVLFALTPRHLQDMLDSLVGFLNAQYAKFMARHPDFKVSSCTWSSAQLPLLFARRLQVHCHLLHVLCLHLPAHTACRAQCP